MRIFLCIIRERLVGKGCSEIDAGFQPLITVKKQNYRDTAPDLYVPLPRCPPVKASSAHAALCPFHLPTGSHTQKLV
ncbi:hypothetical protein QFZ20_000769 [Flavobacterium sp. W4I14]|nr:hypothetical protein [Flavobacterium sp. W4I14]